MRKKAPKIPGKKARAMIKAALDDFRPDGNDLIYKLTDAEVTVQFNRGKIMVLMTCFPMSEGWSISEFGCTESGIRNAIRRAKAEAGIS